MIPKIIHYCWFGGKEKPKKILKCIDTWRKYFPDYEIMEWNELNFDINTCEYVYQAYLRKKYAFVSDYVRLYALYKMGGIYFDTDIEVVKNFDNLLDKNSVLGFEDNQHVATAFIASLSGELWVHNLLNQYNSMYFVDKNGNMDITPNPIIVTNELIKHGLMPNGKHQIIDNKIEVYPFDYFSAFDMQLKQISVSENTVCIHHCDGSWLTIEQKIKMKIKSFIIKKYGINCFNKLKNHLFK